MIGLGLLLAPLVALIVAWTGIYSIAANHGHPGWLNWFLELGMRRSVQANAQDMPAPLLDDPNLVRLGAAHFQGGCAPCHAAPGELVNPIFAGMLPSPPRLEVRVSRWHAHELHWIVLNGLQYAGMPTWSGAGRSDEVWAVVAFLLRLGNMSTEEYQALARGNAISTEGSLETLLREGVATIARTACDRCHDTSSASPASDLVPRLGGQSEEYLVRALREYRADARQSGFMEPIAAQLDDENIAALAAYYAALASPRHAATSFQNVPSASRLAVEGNRHLRIPACLSCHTDGRPEYPLLAGQSARYIEEQLHLFRDGGRRGSHYAEVMTNIAKRLDDRQIAGLAAYFADRPPGEAPVAIGGAQ